MFLDFRTECLGICQNFQYSAVQDISLQFYVISQFMGWMRAAEKLQTFHRFKFRDWGKSWNANVINFVGLYLYFQNFIKNYVLKRFRIMYHLVYYLKCKAYVNEKIFCLTQSINDREELKELRWNKEPVNVKQQRNK